MGWKLDRRLVSVCAAAAIALAACASTRNPPAAALESGTPDVEPAAKTDPSQQPPADVGRVNQAAQSMASLHARVEEYVKLHKKLESTLPSLPREATPQQIDSHQRALHKLIREARRNVQPGDVFTKDSRAVIRRLMAGVFSGSDGAQLKASIMDENPGRLRLSINDRYPDTVPLSTVPPQVLAGLPRLPPELEYRFIGRTLIMFDVHAHMIVDLVEDAIP